MEHMWHSRKSRLAAAATLILLALTCYFCWEILYQERVILNILHMSKDVDDDKVLKALTSDHLEEVVDKWLDAKKREVLNSLRKEAPDATKLTKEELINKMNEKFGSKLDKNPTN